jgi:hypothetical protein
VTDGALQFVPAFPQSSNIEGASWDAILDDEKKEDHPSLLPLPQHPTKAHSFASFQRKYTEAAERASSTAGGRIARLKSLFSSRATIRGGELHAGATLEEDHADVASFMPTPPSPIHSSSGSSAYVRWPGTQDPTGKTVLSSYDDSSVGISSKTAPQKGPVTAVDDDELLHADQQISQWTANTSASTNADDYGSVESLSPVRGVTHRSSSPMIRRIRDQPTDTVATTSFPECDVPESAADFHLAAALADAQAAAAAAAAAAVSVHNAPSVATLRRRFSRTPETSHQASVAETNSDVLRQALPLTRIKGSITPNTAAVHSRPRSFNSAPPMGPLPPSVATVKLATSRSLPTTTPSSSQAMWAPSNIEDTSHANWSPASKTSSAYFNDGDVDAMHLEFPDLALYRPQDAATRPLPAPQANSDLRFCSRQHQESMAASAPPMAAYRSFATRRTNDSAEYAVQPPTVNALEKSGQFSAPHRNFATPTSQGFCGLLDKSKEVPSLLDNFDSDSVSSSKATTVVSASLPINDTRRHAIRKVGWDSQMDEEDVESVSDIFDGISVSKESDVFDNLSFGEIRSTTPRRGLSTRSQVSYPERIAEEDENVVPAFASGPPADDGELKLVLLGGGLTAIQTTRTDFFNRCTATDFDGNLSVSDVSSNGYARIPGYNQMVSAGMNHDSTLRGIQGNLGMRPRARPSEPSAANPRARHEETAQSDDSSTSSSATSHKSSLFSDPYRSDVGLEVFGDLSEYYVHPTLMKKVLRKYRTMSEACASKMNFADYENEEDERKAIALFEMRSRVMEKDIERGLERRGGSFVVDDIVTTPYNRTAHRIRDAVIVSKAWRDGATISDVINSSVLTRRMARTYFTKRPIPREVSAGTSASGFRYSWEAVTWLDDTDMMQYRCPSLGSRHMRGFEMFTIGDCQSILLKLTNERCMVSVWCPVLLFFGTAAIL